MYCNSLYCWQINCSHEGAGASGDLDEKTSQIRDRAKGALFGLLIADALAMPFYDGNREACGKIEGYVSPVASGDGAATAGDNTWEGKIVRQVVEAGGKFDDKALGESVRARDSAHPPLFLVPVALSGQGEEAVDRVVQAAGDPHGKYGKALAHMLQEIVFKGGDVQKVIEADAKAIDVELPPNSAADPPRVIDPTESFRAVLFLASKYAAGGGDSMGQKMARGEAFLNGVFATVNRPHESQFGATDALVGALLGGACGYDNLPRGLVEGLAQREAIDAEVAKFLNDLP